MDLRSSSVTLVLWEASQTRLDAYRKGVTRNVSLLLFVCKVHCLLACYKVLVLLPVEKGVLLTGNRLFANCFQLDLSVPFCVFPVKIKICCLFVRALKTNSQRFLGWKEISLVA